MVSEITWSVDAVDTYNGIIEYLSDKWTEKEIVNFGKRVDQKLEVLQMQPRIGRRISRRYYIYRTEIHKRISLVYRFKPRRNEIELVTFWNTLQNPSRFKI